MTRRDKPSFATATRDSEKAKVNLLSRDRLLTNYYRTHVPAYGYHLYEVDGSYSAEAMTDIVEAHFAKHRAALS